MAIGNDHSAHNPYLQARPSFFDVKPLPKGSLPDFDPDDVLTWGGDGRGEPGAEASPSGGPWVPSAAPSVTAKLTSIELLEGSSAGGGIDWFEVAVIGSLERGERTGKDVYSETAARLEVARVSVTEGQGDTFVEVPGATLRVAPRGSMWGDTWFQWFVEYDGIQLALVRPDSRGSFVSKVRISSLKLTRDGVWAAWDQSVRLLRNLGVIVETTSVYRVDCCIDLPGQKVDPFCESIVERECVTRLRTESKGYRRPNGNWQGADVGNRAGLKIRAYNKSHELDDVGGMESDAKRAALVDSRWGRDAEDVTRIELEIRGAWVRKHWEGCRTVEDVLAAVPKIVHSIVTEFFRMVDGPVDRDNNNQFRAKVSGLWSDVVTVFDAVFGAGVDLVKKKSKPFRVNVEHQRRRLVAAAKSYAAALGPKIATCQQNVLEACLNAISGEWDQSRVIPDLRAKWDYWRSKVTADLLFEERDPCVQAVTDRLGFPDAMQVPMARWRLQDCLVPF